MLMATNLIGFGAGQSGSWQTLWSASLIGNSSGWNGFTLRVVIPKTTWSAITGSPRQIRVTLTSAASAGFTVDGLYVGAKADSGDAYDFLSTPTQIKFSGSGSVTVGSATSLASDGSSFILDQTRDLVVSSHFSGTSSIKSGTATGVSNYNKSISEASTVNATTGYAATSNQSALVTKVEIFG